MSNNSLYEYSIRSNDKFGRILFYLSNFLSIFGGCVLIIIVIINVFSISGRVLFSSPLLGDFELVEMGCAIAIFSFLPFCHLKNGNVIVDFFSSKFPLYIRQLLDILSNFVFLLVASFFTYRMIYGVIDMIKYKEQTMLLKLPVWIAFIPGIFSFFLLALVCFHILLREIINMDLNKIK